MHSARSRSQIATRAGVDPPALTPQESAVARLVALGMGNRQVAAELFISIKTVQFHLTHIYGKLDISTRAELAAQFLDDDTTDRTPPRRRGQDAFERKAKVEPYRGSAAFCGSSTAMPDSGARRLTKLESVVARLVALGKDDRQIAAELFVGIAAVQFHLTQIYTKLGVGSRAELLDGSATVPQLMDSPGVNIN